RTARQRSSGLQQKIGAVAIGVGPVREPSRTSVGRWCGRSEPPGAAARAGRWRPAATLPRSGFPLIPLGGPRIDKASIVEAVDDQASGIAQYHASGAGRERRAAEP